VVALCHNVLPHERGRTDVRLTRAVLRRADALLVHSEAERDKAAALVPVPAEVTPLPPLALTASTAPSAPHTGVARRLLFFGMVRQYKGLDVLLRALALVPDVSLMVAGEFWSGEAQTRSLVGDLGLTDRVEIRSGYVPAAEVDELLAGVDALALPYRAATASAHAYIAHSHGLPVVATRVGNLPEQVRDGVDGLLVEPEDPAALARAITRLYEPGVLDALRAGAAESGTRGADELWSRYVAAFERAAGGAPGAR
jgi:glycosyltransferase involved in cell wall biosynthesis